MIKSELSVDTGSPTRSVPVAGPDGNAFPPEWQSHPRWLTVAVCLFLAAMVWAVFGRTIHYEFINFDDPSYVYKNPIITQGVSWHGIAWVFTHANVGTWFPLTDVSHQLDWQLYGANAGGHHLTNVLLHAATAILLFLVLRKMTGMFWPGAFVAAVFAIHPLRVESVAWVVERKDVLSGLFFMLTLWAWARYAHSRPGVGSREPRAIAAIQTLNPRHWTLDYCLALAFFALGLLSKSMLVTLPFVLLLLDYWPLNRVSTSAPGASRSLFYTWFGLILEKIPFLLLSAAAGAVTVLTQKNAIVTAQNLTIPWRVGNALLAYTDYLRHMVYPVGLAVAYPQSETNPSIWSVGLSALILFTISAGVMAGQRKHPYLVVGWLWYLGMLLPVIDIMQAAKNARADRYTYLPQIGLYILMTWGGMALCASWRHRRAVLGFAAVAILSGLLVGAYIQTSYWKDSISLWTHTLACTSDNSFANNILGRALAAQGKWDDAIRHHELALQLKPDFVDAHVDLGVALVSQRRREEAIPHFEQALQLNPDSADAHYDLGDALAAQGKSQEAIKHFERALQLKPDYADAHYDLGLALAAQGKWDEAIQHYEQALHLKLDYAQAQYITGVAFATEKKWDKAIELYKRALQLKPDYAEAHNNLGIALASQGKLAEAIQHFQRALALATTQDNTALADSIRNRLKSYPPDLPQAQTP
jgi:tetratricopeptide (TPR) repeat protein